MSLTSPNPTRSGELVHRPETGPLATIEGGLIVSCQAPPDDPMSGPGVMAKMAATVVAAGARAVRVEGLDDLRAVRAAVDVPVVGLWKVGNDGVYITPTVDHALAVAATGAEIVALDATARPRPDGRSLAETVAAVHEKTPALVMADISSYDEGVAAVEAGADVIATTLAGYTMHDAVPDGPDLALLTALARDLPVPVVCEGRISTPRAAGAARRAGAFAVVVGTAITRPHVIAAGFVEAVEE
nr:N-acetylmannosamine-6-phosphate 2-epimerase [Phytoactinopolyspora alkaliphila]